MISAITGDEISRFPLLRKSRKRGTDDVSAKKKSEKRAKRGLKIRLKCLKEMRKESIRGFGQLKKEKKRRMEWEFRQRKEKNDENFDSKISAHT